MKKTLLSVFVLVFAFIACNSNNDKTKETKTENIDNKTEQMYACSMHPEVTGKKEEKCYKCGMELTVPVVNNIQNSEPSMPSNKKVDTTKPVSIFQQSDFSVKVIVADYLQLKNALTKDNTKGAAAAANSLLADLSKVDGSSLSASREKNLTDITDDAKEHAEHIGSNAGKIEHQREHFEMLSKDIYDLVKAFGGDQVLYKDFCPMYNNNKGAFWVSETKDIRNPYFGKAMLTCGMIEEEIK